MIKVMIAEDDVSQLQLFNNFLTKETNFKIVALTTSGKETIEKYLEEKPDVLFLDLDMPNINGLGVLNYLKEKSDKKNIIVTSHSKELISNLYDFSNIYRLMPKPFDYFKAVSVAQELVSTHSLISTKEKIKHILLKLGFNPSSTGTDNFIELIYIKCQRKNSNLKLNKLYSITASKTGFYTALQIKWSIDNSLSSAKRCMNKELLYSIFDNYNPAYTLTPLYLSDLIVDSLKKDIVYS